MDVVGQQQHQGEQIDGLLYSYDGPIDSDGYPIGMRELAEENYAACLSDAELRGVQDPTTECDVSSFFEAAAKEHEQNVQAGGDV
jgi:hypothetical protein